MYSQPNDAISVEEYHTQIHAAMSEDALLAHILGHCREFGLLHHHVFEQRNYARRTDRGWPDLVIVMPGRTIFAELKSERGRVSPDQARWLDILATQHREVYLVRPSTEDLFLEVLMQPGRQGSKMQKIVWKEGMK